MTDEININDISDGLLRDLFAGLAINGVIENMEKQENDKEAAKIIASCVYLIADAMLAERRKK